MILQKTFVKFILVGILNTAFGYTIFSLLIFLKCHYSLAMLLATIIGILFNFKTTGKFVFANTNNKLLFKFILTYGVVYLTNIMTLKVLLLFTENIYLAGAVSTIAAALLSYLLNKEFVFQGSKL